MSNRLAILCSGQAGQHAGMFDIICENIEAKRLLQSLPLEDVCEHALDKILSDDALLFSNRIAQPLVAAAALTAWEAVKETMPRPAIVAGYSIGELASWSVAGAITPEETIRLAALRANLLQSCVASGQPQTMLAVSLSRTLSRSLELGHLLQLHGFFVAIEVDEESVIAGGLLANAASLEAEITRLGGKLTRLPIEIASHTPFMRNAVTPFKRALEKSGFSDPECIVLAGISGVRLHHKNEAFSALSRQLAEPIRWHAVMDSLAEAGVTIAIELGPGSALSRMIKSRHPHIESRSLADFRSLTGVRKWLERSME
jgi:[acyl-carrier-protein] S-malonyltransferase